MHRALIFCLVGFLYCASLCAAPLILFEDQFSGSALGPDWIEQDGYEESFFWDPSNFATFEMTGTHLRMSFPAGAEHNQFNLTHAALVYRTFLGSGVYEAKLDTSMTGYQQFGLIFQNTNAETSIAFLLYSDGVNLRGFVERFSKVDGVVHKVTVAGTPLGYTIPVAGPFHLRGTVYDNPDPTKRRWIFEWSRDGVAWIKVFDAIYEGAASTDHIGEIKQVGFFIGDQAEYYGAVDQPFSVDVDHFRFMLPEMPPVHARTQSGRVELFWDRVAGADTYQVYRSLQPSSGFSLVGTTSIPEFVENGLQNDVRYYYYVVPRRGAQSGGPSATISAVPHVTVIDSVPSSGLVLALAANELAYSYSNGQPVTQWVSAAGERTVVSAAGPSAPTYIASALNGVPTVRFDGIDDYMTLSSGFQDFTSGISLFVVMRPNGLQKHSKVLLLGNGPTGQNIGFGRGVADGWQFFTSDNSRNVAWFEAATGPVTGEATVMSVLMEPGAPESTQYAAITKNSTLLRGDGAFVPPVVERTLNYIGNSYWADGRLHGDVSEIILYNRLLTPSERSTVHDYLQGKYGLGSPAPVFPPPLASPGNLTAAASDGTVTLRWSPVLRAAGYRIHRREEGTAQPTLIANISGTTYTNSPVVNGRTYHFSIEAYKNAETATSGEVSATPLAPPPLPAGIPTSGLILALDATAISQQLAPGHLVTTWPDASSSRHDAVATSGSAPLLVANAIGDKPAMRFDGTDDYLTMPAGFSDFSAGMSMYVVMRPNGPPTFWKLVALGNAGGAQGIGLGRSSTTPGLQLYTANQAGSFDWFSTSAGVTQGEASLVAAFQEPGSPNSISYAAIHQNENSLFGDEVFVPANVTRTVNYVAKSPWNDGNFGGDIAEILVYNRLLNNSERAAVQNYFGQKYGFNMTPAAFPPPLAPAQNVRAIAGEGVVNLGWSPVLRATSYRIFRRAGAVGAFNEIANIAATNYADSAVINGTSYTYFIRAHRPSETAPDSAQAAATPLAAPPVPAGIPTSGLLLLLDAEGIAQQVPTGHPVTTWLDASPLRNNAVSRGGVPALVHNAIGGKAALRFDGIDDAMQLPTGFAGFTAGMSVFAVYRPAAIRNNMKLFVFGNSGGFDSFGIGNSGASQNLLHFTANSGTFDWFSTAAGPAAGEASLLSIHQEAGAAGSGSYAAVFKNSTLLGGDIVYVPATTPRSANYIADTYWNDERFQGDIAELVVYNRLLSSSERTALHDYFTQKYGLGGNAPPFPPALLAPANVIAVSGDATVTLNWSVSSQASGYRVYRLEGASGTPSLIASVSGLSFTDTSVSNGQTYSYYLRAFNASQESADSAPVTARPAAPPEPPPGIPVDGLMLSLNAQSLAEGLNDGENVLVWPDASPGRKDAFAPGGAPVLVANGIGGKPSVRFDGVDDYLQLPGGFDSFVNGLSLYMVVRPSVVHRYTKLLLLGTGSDANSIGLSRADLAEGLLFHTGSSTGSVEWFQTSTGFPTGEPSALAVLLAGGPANSLSLAEIVRNGTVVQQEEVFVPPVVTRTLNFIGNSYWNDGPFQGDIAEVLLYNRVLTPLEESAVHAYFSQEYGITFE